MKQTVFICLVLGYLCSGCKSSIDRLQLSAVDLGEGSYSAYYVPVEEPVINKLNFGDGATPAFTRALLSDEFQLFPVNTLGNLIREQVVTAVRLIANDALCSQQVLDSNGRTLLADGVYQLSSVHLSPNGTKITFSCKQTPASGWAVWIVNRDGSEPRLLTFGKDPVWKNDTTLIYSALDAEGWTIKQCESDGSHRRILVKDDQDCMQPQFSPDGKMIAFVKQPRGAVNSDVYVCAADGTGVSQVTRYPGLDDSPIWGLDGKTLYFRSTRQAKWGAWSVPVD